MISDRPLAALTDFATAHDRPAAPGLGSAARTGPRGPARRGRRRPPPRVVPAPVARDAGPGRAGSGAVLLRAVAREARERGPAGRPGAHAETSGTERGD